MRHRTSLPVLLWLLAGASSAAGQERAQPWAGSGIRGRIETYASKMDGKQRPYAVCATSDSAEPKPLVVVVSPGAPTEAGRREIELAESYAWYAKKNGRECVVLRATGRGPGSVYQNYGELDVLESIEDVKAKFPVDADRISVTGFSMGGAATWYLVSHYPDLFAAAAPMAGYCDYRLWEKPGGFTFPMQPWEEPSWQARSAAFLVDNLEHTPLWIVHGEWDRSVGGGVPVEHSRRMYARLSEKGFNVKYTELPGTGHSAPQDVFEQVTLWLIRQKKERSPRHVALTTWELRHNRSYWVAIDQMEHSGRRALVDARRTGRQLSVRTENVRVLSLGPLADVRTVAMDGQKALEADFGQAATFRRDGRGVWRQGAADLAGEKQHGSSGPISDIYFDPVLLVPGTTGSDEETHFNVMMAANTAGLFRSENGGLHRGGIRGSNTVDLTVVRDVDLSEEQIRNHNLLLFGTAKSNAVVKRYEGKLPLAFDSASIRLGDRRFSGERVAVYAVFPHPERKGRYVAVNGGVTADAPTWSSHFSLQLLPDFLVFDGGRMIEWGFWDNEWKRPSPWGTGK